MKSPLLADSVSPAVPSCGHLFILFAEGLIFPSHKTISSDIGQGYEVGARPVSGPGISSGGDLTSERGLGVRGITESTVGVGLFG